MTNIPENLQYTKDDEWVRVEDGVATIGITDYAQDSLSDIVYLELPDVDDVMIQGESFGVVESVKAAADLYAPLSGTVIEVNDALIDAPEGVNEEPYGKAWLLKMRVEDEAQLTGLLSSVQYKAMIDERG